jgi:uncharacterized protein YndB with AHSA1/START domain
MAITKLTAEPGKMDTVFDCVIDAPRELVYRVYVDKEMIPRWWGPRIYSTEVDAYEFRHGGKWRFIQTDSDGQKYSFRGVYHEIIPLERITSTFEYEQEPGHITLETVIFEDLGEKTRLINQSVFQSVEDRDQMIAEDMESGMIESMNRIEEILVSERNPR